MLTKSTCTYHSIYDKVKIYIGNEVLTFAEEFSQGVYKQYGLRYAAFSEETRSQVVSAFPREGFKQKWVQTLLDDGYRHKPETTYGNIHSDVCERHLPGYKRPNFCDVVVQSPWNE